MPLCASQSAKLGFSGGQSAEHGRGTVEGGGFVHAVDIQD